MIPRRDWLLALASLCSACSACSGRDVGERPEPAAATEPADYVGVWAAEPDLCGRSVWRLSRTSLAAESGATCRLSDMRPDAGGWAGTAHCGQDRPAVISLRVAAAPEPAPAPALVVTGPFSAVPVTLVRCPEAPGSAGPDPFAFLDRAAEVDRRIASRDPRVTEAVAPDNLVVRRVWRADGTLLKIIEPLLRGDPGATRSYYFDGQGRLFFIRDPDGGFGFEAGRLTTHYGASGERLSGSPRAEEELAARLLREAEVAREMAESVAAGRDGKASSDG